DANFHEEVKGLYRLLHAEENADQCFVDAGGRGHLERLILSLDAPASCAVILAGLYFVLSKFPFFPMIKCVKGSPSFVDRLFEAFCLQNEYPDLQRAFLYILSEIVDVIPDSHAVLMHAIERFQGAHPTALDPLETLVERMVTQRDSCLISSGLKVINTFI